MRIGRSCNDFSTMLFHKTDQDLTTILIHLAVNMSSEPFLVFFLGPLHDGDGLESIRGLGPKEWDRTSGLNKGDLMVAIIALRFFRYWTLIVR